MVTRAIAGKLRHYPSRVSVLIPGCGNGFSCDFGERSPGLRVPATILVPGESGPKNADGGRTITIAGQISVKDIGHCVITFGKFRDLADWSGLAT